MKTNSYWMTKLHGAEFKVLRLQETPTDNAPTDTPEAIVRYLREQLPNSPAYNPDVESLIVILLNARLRPIGWQIISTGTLDTLLVHPREVFKPAIVMNAAAIVLAHNHPSGDPSPSEADIKVTRDMIRAGQLMKIEVIDHVIMGRATPEQPKEYASLRELGYLTP
jgi:DNA repair protein RadC